MGEWILALHLATQIVIPAAMAQLTKCKLDDIRQLLNKWSMTEKGTSDITHDMANI